MAQEGPPERRGEMDPLHDVKEEIVQSGRPPLRHVDLHEKTPEDVQKESTVKSEVPEPFVQELKDDHHITEGSHDVSGKERSPERRGEMDPLHDVKEEIVQSGRPSLRHVDLHEKTPEDVQKASTVKSEVPEPFVQELKDDHHIAEGSHDVSGKESNFQGKDPLLDVKQEVESDAKADSESRISYAAAAAKSIDPPALEEVSGKDHEVAQHDSRNTKKPDDQEVAATHAGDEHADIDNSSYRYKVLNADDSGFRIPGRGKPTFRISAHHGMRPGGPLSRDLKSETSEGDPLNASQTEEKASNDPKDEDTEVGAAASSAEEPQNTDSIRSSKALTSGGGRGTPAFRVSAHHGMRPGGPLSRDLKSETTDGSKDGDEDVSSNPQEPEAEKCRASGMRGGHVHHHHRPRPPTATSNTKDFRQVGPKLGEDVEQAAVDETGPDLLKGPELHRGPAGGAVPRRGGLARSGSGVPGEANKGGNGLARAGSGLPGSGSGLARTGSGVPGSGNRLGRTGSGVPPASKGGDGWTNFSASLNAEPSNESQAPEQVDEKSHEEKGILGKIGEKLSNLNTYQTASPAESKGENEVGGSKSDVGTKAFPDDKDEAAAWQDVTKSETVAQPEPGFLQKVKEGIKDQLLPTKSLED